MSNSEDSKTISTVLDMDVSETSAQDSQQMTTPTTVGDTSAGIIALRTDTIEYISENSSHPSIYVTGSSPQQISHVWEPTSLASPVLANDWILKLKEIEPHYTNYDILNGFLENLIEMDMGSGVSPVARLLIVGFMDILTESGLHPTPVSRSVEAYLGLRQIQLRNFLTTKCNQNEDVYVILRLFLIGLIQSLCFLCCQESSEPDINSKQWMKMIAVLTHLLTIDFEKQRPSGGMLLSIVNNLPESTLTFDTQTLPLGKEVAALQIMKQSALSDTIGGVQIEKSSSSSLSAQQSAQSSSKYHSLPTPNNSSEDIVEASDLEAGGQDRRDAQEVPVGSQPIVKPWSAALKIAFMLIPWFIFTVILIMKSEIDKEMHQVSIPVGAIKDFWLREHPSSRKVELSLRGAFLPEYYGNLTSSYLSVWIQLVEIAPGHEPISKFTDFNQENVRFSMNLTEPWNVPLVSTELLDFVPNVITTKTLELRDFNKELEEKSILRLQMVTNIDAILPVGVLCDTDPIDTNSGIGYGAAVLVGLYILIITDIVPRTLAAMMASTMTVAILAAMDERPTTKEIISWIDIETLLLLFSMMMLVAFLADTGFFDFLAVYAYKVTKGNIWLLLIIFCLITAAVSTVLDNVTTILLMTPVIIKLCEARSINPKPIIMASVIYSNIGGSLTPVGDPPNVIIASNEIIANSGVDFLTFTLHMGAGVVIILFVTFCHIRFLYRKHDDLSYTQDSQQLNRAAAFKRAAASLSSYSKNEEDVRRTLKRHWYRILRKITGAKSSTTGRESNTGVSPNEDLAVMKEKYRITDVPLLMKSLAALIFVIILFFLHSVPSLHLSLGWSALLGVLFLLILVDEIQLDSVVKKVEWGTLLFFAALFIVMEGLSRLGLIGWIGQQTEYVILYVNKESQLAVAIMLILWVSALSSAFVDNIPLTTMMVRIVTALAENKALDLPLTPLVWALAFGACLGGNGTLIGASANVVAVSVAEAHGYGITFMEYFKVGFPVMVVNVAVASLYLLVCHVWFEWH